MLTDGVGPGQRFQDLKARSESPRALDFFLGMERMLSDQALKQGRLEDALAHTGDEGRSTLR